MTGSKGILEMVISGRRGGGFVSEPCRLSDVYVFKSGVVADADRMG